MVSSAHIPLWNYLIYLLPHLSVLLGSKLPGNRNFLSFLFCIRSPFTIVSVTWWTLNNVLMITESVTETCLCCPHFMVMLRDACCMSSVSARKQVLDFYSYVEWLVLSDACLHSSKSNHRGPTLGQALTSKCLYLIHFLQPFTMSPPVHYQSLDFIINLRRTEWVGSTD